MNNVVLIGNLTKDPELRFIPNSGTAVTRFSIAVRREFKKEGQPDADFFNIVVWGKQAESCANYLKKGRKVAIKGSLRNNNYEDKNGVKHYNVEVNADRVEFIDWGNDNQNNQQTYQQPVDNQQQPNRNQQNYGNDFDSFQAIDGDEDIPF